MKRLIKADSKSKGCKVSKKQKIKCQMNLFITNAKKEHIKANQVKAIYSLRWQIELIFKVWKSLCKVAVVKKIKIQRFQCMLIARLIWILINWKVYSIINNKVIKETKKHCCSIWKYFKKATRKYDQLRAVIFGRQSIKPWLEVLLKNSQKQLLLEKKKGKVTHIEILRGILKA